jgi:hypothetical protein
MLRVAVKKPSPTSPLRIDLETFVYLATAIAVVGCVHEPKPVPPPSAAAPAPDTSGAVGVPTIASAAPAPPPPDDGPPPEPTANVEPPTVASLACDNDVGEVSCDFARSPSFGGPACEGFEGTCDLLAEGQSYRLRVGAAAARCFAQKGRGACDIRVRTKCYRAALQEACPDPSFVPQCEAAVSACHAQHQRPDFTVDECVKALSSLQGGDLGWAESAMGPTAEGCRLAFPVF